jgi:hypothetical protein
MNPLPFASPRRLLIAFAAISLAISAAPAQDSASIPAPAAPASQSAQPAQPSQPVSPAENEWLAKTAKLYYSSAKAGLTGFDCAVHPDWHTLFVTANKRESTPDDDASLALLNTVKITLHARMKGGSTIEWVAAANPDKPLDESSTALLDGMHQSVEQTLEGFLQFWSPFIEDTVVPDSSEGLEITHTPTVHTIHAKQGTTELTEVFDHNLVLEQFNVNLNGTSIKFSPAYRPTEQGLLVNGFVARILPPGATPAQAQEMKVAVDYQPLNGLTIPSHLNMEVIGTGVFNFTFDACSNNPK